MATKQQLSISLKDLLEAGAHFGHQTHRWNPKMKRFIFGERNGLYIIDLAKTMQQLREAVEVVQNLARNHQPILFVGTKKQAKTVVREIAEECEEFYVCERWLGGMLTNLSTMRQSIKKLDRFEKRLASGAEGLTKKEKSQLGKKLEKLERNLSGIRKMRKMPGLVVVVDTSREHIAVAEAKKLGIPVMGIVDTNCDPDDVDYVIAANDDALKSVKLILKLLGDVILEEKKKERAIDVKEKAAEEAISVKPAEKEKAALVGEEKSE